MTEALLDDIIFSMEDQEGIFFIDCPEGVVVNIDDCRAELEQDMDDRFISLPEWDSSSGFRLMERFAAAFRNPLIRNELCAALNRGKGVFRAFKNTLSQYPEAEKLWFSYKEREMKREVIRWYNGLREEWGLKKIGLEPEETGDLVLEDFRFREIKDDDRNAIELLHALCRSNSDPDFPGENANETFTLTAETGSNEFAGYITADLKDGDFFIRALEVKPEFRGLGIGKALLENLLEKSEKSQTGRIFIDLPSESDGFSKALTREGFLPRMTRYCLSR